MGKKEEEKQKKTDPPAETIDKPNSTAVTEKRSRSPPNKSRAYRAWPQCFRGRRDLLFPTKSKPLGPNT